MQIMKKIYEKGDKSNFFFSSFNSAKDFSFFGRIVHSNSIVVSKSIKFSMELHGYCSILLP